MKTMYVLIICIFLFATACGTQYTPQEILQEQPVLTPPPTIYTMPPPTTHTQTLPPIVPPVPPPTITIPEEPTMPP